MCINVRKKILNMAKGPKELLELTDEDTKAVSALEAYIDNHEKMKAFDGSNITIEFPSEIIEKYLNIRFNVRMDALKEQYRKAGWEEVLTSGLHTKPKLIELHRYATYYDR